MFKKVSLIIILSILLAGALVFRHFFWNRSNEPTLADRLPIGDYLVKAKVLDLAHELTGMLHYNKVDFRDFASKEFLLGQGKSYGLDLQRPVYAFVNEEGSWGAMVYVSDSSEISAGLQRISKFIVLKDSVIDDQKYYHWEKEDGYLAYGKNWLFIYKGKAFPKIIRKIIYAKKDEISPIWSQFIKEKQFNTKSLVIYSNSRGIQKYGIEKALFTHQIDSTSVTLLTYVKSLKPMNFSQKAEGLAMEKTPGSNKYLNLQLNVEDFKGKTDDPLYRLIDRKSKKIGFPLDDFLKVWTGDLSFREGENQIVKETFIETQLDDNFEVSEVVSVKERKVKGFAVALSMNSGAEAFWAKMKKKGLLTEENGKYRFLISPPLTMVKSKGYYLFYSGEKAPKLLPNKDNSGYLSYKNTPFTFHLDTVIGNEAFGKIEFPVDRVLRRNKFF